MPCCRKYAALLLAFELVAGAQPGTGEAAGPPPVVTVCEVLSDLPRYDHKVVIVVGRLVTTSEGAWLNEDCGLKVTNGGREFKFPSISLTPDPDWFDPPPTLPKAFQWDKSLLSEKLKQVKKTTRLRRGEKWDAEFGRLETKLPWPLPAPEGVKRWLIGFGHEGGSPAQMVSPERGYLVMR